MGEDLAHQLTVDLREPSRALVLARALSMTIFRFFAFLRPELRRFLDYHQILDYDVEAARRAAALRKLHCDPVDPAPQRFGVSAAWRGGVDLLRPISTHIILAFAVSISILLSAVPSAWAVRAVTLSKNSGPLGSAFRWSSAPTGQDPGTVVFASRVGREAVNIFAMRGDGSRLVRLTATDSVDQDPALSPDGRRIAFVSYRDGGFGELYIMNVDGSQQTRLTTDGVNWIVDHRHPRFSPDGRRLVYAAGRWNVGYETFIMNIDGTGKVRVVTGLSHELNPSFSPDGRKILLASRDALGLGIFVVDLAARRTVRMSPPGAHDLQPRWSLDGAKIVFVCDSSGRTPYTLEICLMRADGTRRMRLTRNSYLDLHPTFSPDGKTIAFASRRDRGDEQIYTIGTDGTRVTRRTHTVGFSTNPDWGSAQTQRYSPSR